MSEKIVRVCVICRTPVEEEEGSGQPEILCRLHKLEKVNLVGIRADEPEDNEETND